jgi:hypothetical protein
MHWIEIILTTESLKLFVLKNFAPLVDIIGKNSSGPNYGKVGIHDELFFNRDFFFFWKKWRIALLF